MTSFFLTDAQTLAQGTPVMSLHAVLDWPAIRAQLTGLYRREFSHAGGPIPYDALGMFKLMLLGQWHGLSDAQLEQALRVRIDFMVFTGFEPSAGELPDAITICRFRNRLAKANAHQRLLKEVNRQLEHAGLKVSGAQGAIIDATIIPSAARPNTELEVDQDDPGAPPEVSLCADDQARWTKKGKKSFLGYKGYSAVDAEDGYTEVVSVAPANESEVNKLEGVVDQLTDLRGQAPHGVLADKGYHSAANREMLKARSIVDFIQHKASRNNPLQAWQKRFNALVAKVRFKVEQSYGTMKRRFHLSRARYFGRLKVEAQMVWAALGMNLLKAHRKIENWRFAGSGAS
jgi:transposase, IS5 family